MTSDKLLVEHLPAVRAFLRSEERDADIRAEVEAQLALMSRGLKPTSTTVEKVRSFFVGVAANLLRRQRRQERRRREVLDQLASLHPTPPTDPEQALAHREEIEEVLSGLAALPKAQRDALVLTAVEGLSVRDAAKHEAVPDATVRTRVFWARKNLEAFLGRSAPSKRTRALVILGAVLAVSTLSWAMAPKLGTWLAPLLNSIRQPRKSVGAPPRQADSPVHAPSGSADVVPTPPPEPPPPPGPPVPEPKVEPATPPPEQPPAAEPVRALSAPGASAPPPAPSSATEGPHLSPPPPPPAPSSATESPPLSPPPPPPPPERPAHLEAYQRALAYQLAARNHEAALAWTTFLDIAPDGPLRQEARFRRSLAWAREGRWDLARPELEALARSHIDGVAIDAARVLEKAPR